MRARLNTQPPGAQLQAHRASRGLLSPHRIGAMPMTARVRVFIASSLDGFIAGPDDDLSWLPTPDPEITDFGYGAFMARIGALLMGRRTYDVVEGFGGDWPYGQRPVLVATRNPLELKIPTVRAVEGSVLELIEQAREAAGELDVYIDGGDLIRQALDAGLIDEVILSVIPTILGAGTPLFAGHPRRHDLTLVSSQTFNGGLVQLTYRPTRYA
jgi:dihydrofolate reductase